jgi:hypothetical protein
MDNAPKLPTIWLMPLSNAPQCLRILEIDAGNRPSDLGFLESDLDGTHDGIGFQESRQERIIVWSDFRNPSRKRTRFGWISRIGVRNGGGEVCNVAKRAIFT